VGGQIRPHALGTLDPRAEQVLVAMRDGVRLATDVYLPVRPGKLPAVLVRLPYDKSGEFSFMSEIAERLTGQGYAVVVQDVRGKARSEGATFAFTSELLDGYDTVEWMVRQSWSNGVVGTFGDSYYGFTQWALAAAGHPAVRAMVPRMTTTEIGSDWMYLDGVFNLGTMGEWALHTWIDASLNDAEIDWSVRPLSRFIESNAGGATSESFSAWLQYGSDHPFWTTGIYGERTVPYGRVPTLHVGGWFDVFSRGQLRDHQRSLRGAAGTEQYLDMGASDHFDDVLTASGVTPDYLERRELIPRFLDSYLGPAERFFARHLLGFDEALPPVRYQTGNGPVRDTSSWPPPGARALDLHLVGWSDAVRTPAGGGLSPRPDRLGGHVEWIHDPSDPVPSLVADPWRPLLRLPDERAIHARPDVITFTSAEFTTPLDLAGPVRAEVLIEADAPSTHLVARLCDVFPDGRAHLVVEGAVLVRDPTPWRACVVDLGDTAYRVRTGHRLRLQLASSSYPRYVVHPGTGEDPFSAMSTRKVIHRMRSGAGSDARLQLTVLPDGGADGVDESD
jgi:putative CocE/NonD family hydrolase